MCLVPLPRPAFRSGCGGFICAPADKSIMMTCSVFFKSSYFQIRFSSNCGGGTCRCEAENYRASNRRRFSFEMRGIGGENENRVEQVRSGLMRSDVARIDGRIFSSAIWQVPEDGEWAVIALLGVLKPRNRLPCVNFHWARMDVKTTASKVTANATTDWKPK